MSDTEFDISTSNVSESLLKQEQELLRRNKTIQKNSMRIVKQAEAMVKEGNQALEESGTRQISPAAEGFENKFKLIRFM
jgi:hypothetical protein